MVRRLHKPLENSMSIRQCKSSGKCIETGSPEWLRGKRCNCHLIEGRTTSQARVGTHHRKLAHDERYEYDECPHPRQNNSFVRGIELAFYAIKTQRKHSRQPGAQ